MLIPFPCINSIALCSYFQLLHRLTKREIGISRMCPQLHKNCWFQFFNQKKGEWNMLNPTVGFGHKIGPTVQ